MLFESFACGIPTKETIIFHFKHELNVNILNKNELSGPIQVFGRVCKNADKCY